MQNLFAISTALSSNVRITVLDFKLAAETVCRRAYVTTNEKVASNTPISIPNTPGRKKLLLQVWYLLFLKLGSMNYYVSHIPMCDLTYFDPAYLNGYEGGNAHSVFEVHHLVPRINLVEDNRKKRLEN